MSNENPAPTPMQQMVGDFSPAFVALTDDVLYGDVWNRAGLSPRDRALATIAAFIASGEADKIEPYLHAARGAGVSEDEIKELVIHLAFYAGWPKAVTAMTVAKRVFSV